MALSAQQLWSRVRKKWLSYCLISVFAIFGVNLYHAYLGNPFKTTDPASPSFDIAQFDLLDYPRGRLGPALIKLFPVGTGKSRVELVMSSAGAKPNSHMDSPQIVRYDFPRNLWDWKQGPFITFVFDQSGHLLNIHPLGEPKLFADQIGVDEIREGKHE